MMRPVTCIYYYPIINGAVAGKFSTSWSDEDWEGRAALQKKVVDHPPCGIKDGNIRRSIVAEPPSLALHETLTRVVEIASMVRCDSGGAD